MTEDQSKSYNGCPTGKHFVQHVQIHPAALLEVASWAQAVLTALNVGDIKGGSPLHMKLREVMIAYRDELNAADQPQPPKT